jgi:predicted ester cyclase
MNGGASGILNRAHVAQKFEHLLDLAEGNTVVGRHTAHGTHRGELLGIPRPRNG